MLPNVKFLKSLPNWPDDDLDWRGEQSWCEDIKKMNNIIDGHRVNTAIISWCREQFGYERWIVLGMEESNEISRYGITRFHNKGGRWDYIGNIIYFRDAVDMVFFKMNWN